jgi:hypothetical protein
LGSAFKGLRFFNVLREGLKNTEQFAKRFDKHSQIYENNAVNTDELPQFSTQSGDQLQLAELAVLRLGDEWTHLVDAADQ